MSDSEGPWKQIPQPKRAPSSGRFWLWLALLLVAGAGVWKLADIFPGQVASDWDRANIMQLIVVLGIVSAGVVFGRRMNFKVVLRNLAIWAGVVAVLVLGFTFQDELRDVGLRIQSELIPGEPISTTAGELVLSQSADGHFYVIGEANGARIRFLIDTGASDIVISPKDAARIGIDVTKLDFQRTYQTANGLGLGTSYRLNSLTIGPFALSEVPISINQADMGTSLLGMSFLKQMASFEIRGRQLYLRAH